MVLQLDCPLCCSETFSCYNSLKYHLLSVIDNLLCPSCQKRFDNVLELALHVGRQCADDPLTTQDDTINGSPKLSEDVDVHTEVEYVFLNETVQSESDSVPLEDDSEVTPQLKQKDKYSCSTCNTEFTSVHEHIMEFHPDEEIRFEDGSEDAQTIDCPTINSERVSEPEDAKVLKKSAKLLNTIQQEDCVDKAGRLYLRKTVKIEKFWDDDIVVDNAETNCDDLNVNRKKPRRLSKKNELLELYECTVCTKTLSSMELYWKHKCDYGLLTCDICGEQITTMKRLRAHIREHMKLKRLNNSQTESPFLRFICDICTTEFASSKSLRLHQKMHEPVKIKDIEPPASYGLTGESLNDGVREMFKCDVCKKSYDVEYEDAHRESHRSGEDLNCEVCNRKFQSHENLVMHMKIHIDGKKFFCIDCKKAFLTQDKLEAHKSEKCQKRQYECQYCGRRFSRPHEKVKHERIHTGEKPHICGVCGKAFRVNYCLTLHMRTHSGTRPYQCEVCGKRFKSHSVYAHHLQIHSNDRKYKCTFCPKMFKTRVQLAGHKNSHIKPFSCTECNRPFASLYAVRGHMETHQRQNNLKYNCWLCGASYARAFALRDHFKEHHTPETADMETENSEVIETKEVNELNENTYISS